MFSLGGGLGLFLLLFGIGVLWFGGIGQFIAFANGKPLYISPHLLDLGSLEVESKTVAVFKMTNLSSKEISVVGEHSSCDCVFSEKIPIVVPSGKTVDLKVSVHLPRYDSSYDQTLVFMVAEPSKMSMHPVRVTATIRNPLPRPTERSESVAPVLAPLINENKN